MEPHSTALNTGDLTDGEIRDLPNTFTRRTPQPKASGRGRPVSNSHVSIDYTEEDEFRHNSVSGSSTETSSVPFWADLVMFDYLKMLVVCMKKFMCVYNHYCIDFRCEIHEL